MDHRSDTPLASCEKRARLALERGELSQAAYASLMGVTAEALLARPKAKNNDDASSDDGACNTAHVTPCDSPPRLWSEEQFVQVQGQPPPQLQLGGPQGYLTINDKGRLKPRVASARVFAAQERYQEQKASGKERALEDQRREGEERVEQTMLDNMRAQGLSLADRARRYEQEQQESTATKEGGSSSTEPTKKNDQRLLDFVDICLKENPPTSVPIQKTDSTTFRDLVWQNRLGLTQAPATAPRLEGARDISDNARWELRYDELLQFRSIHGHCIVPFRYGPNKSLGGWVQKQRDAYNRAKMPLHRYHQLTRAGFSWVLEKRRIPKIKNDAKPQHRTLPTRLLIGQSNKLQGKLGHH